MHIFSHKLFNCSFVRSKHITADKKVDFYLNPAIG